MKRFPLHPIAKEQNPGVPTVWEERFRACARDSRGRTQYSIHKTRAEAEKSCACLKGWPWKNARVIRTLQEFFRI
jgi:hypothetical protein